MLCTTASAPRTSRASTSRDSGRLRSIASERLLRLKSMKPAPMARERPGRTVRNRSPCSGSILMTSAPRSPSVWVAYGPEHDRREIEDPDSLQQWQHRFWRRPADAGRILAADASMRDAGQCFTGLDVASGLRMERMGPLQGSEVIELAGLGPGAVLRHDAGRHGRRRDPRRSGLGRSPVNPIRSTTLLRNRRSIALNLKSPAGIATLLRLIDGADALIEGFRPGRHGAPGRRAGRLSRAQSPAGLRTHDGLGPVRTARAVGRPRHQLPRAHRRAAPDRRTRPQARAAAEPRRAISAAAP